MNNKNQQGRPQDDLPYEQRMLYIIKDYRRISGHVENARHYAETLERENKELKRQFAILNTRHSNDVKDVQETHRKIKLLKGMLQAAGIQVTRRMLKAEE